MLHTGAMSGRDKEPYMYVPIWAAMTSSANTQAANVPTKPHQYLYQKCHRRDRRAQVQEVCEAGLVLENFDIG